MKKKNGLLKIILFIILLILLLCILFIFLNNKEKKENKNNTQKDNDVVKTPKFNNEPALVDGLTPVKWNGTDWIKTTSSDPDWYDYNNKEWANAMTSDGSMWVWIPRYIYKISSGWHTTTTGTIDIKFVVGTDDTVDGTVSITNTGGSSDSNDTWTSHPSFTFGDTELTGIWVAKFEATAAEGVSNSASGDNTISKTVKIIPNAQSWRYISTDYMFKVSRNMEINKVYGWGTTGKDIDTHVIKNVEWGAVAYLSKSIYGQGQNKIWTNPNNSFTTGCAGTSALASSTSACEKYNTENGVHASTTGNVYGVYDMVGGTWERTFANYNDISASSGIASVSSIEDKYIDRYSGENRGYNAKTKGDAVYETSVGATYNGESWDGSLASGWDGAYAAMPYTTLPWFGRGGVESSAKGAGIFNFVTSAGNVDGSCTFRPVLLVNKGL